MDFLLISASLVVLLLFWYHGKKCNNVYKFLEKFPGPPSIPFFGNLYNIRKTSDILNKLLEYQFTYGSIFHLCAGLFVPIQFAIVVTDTKFLEFVLGSQKVLSKSFTYDYLHNWIRTGLLTSKGKKWKQRRKTITPTFHFQILEDFVEVFNSQGRILVKKLTSELGRQSTNVYPYVTLCTLDIICESAMGTSVNAQMQPGSEYVQCVKEMCRIVFDRTISPFKMIDALYCLTKDYYKEKRAVKILHDYTDSVIIARKKELELNGDVVKEDEFGRKRKMAFLDLLLRATCDGKPLENEDIREEVDTFMFEGHDTTSSAITFTLYSLANNPDVQKKAVQELVSIFGTDKERPATYNDLQEMKYLELVIKETLRLYPSVPIYARCLEEDIEYENMILPTGLTIIVFAYGLHRDPKLYHDPEKFIPERFTQENCMGKSPYSYVPFSAGPRNCIGQRFAFLEMKATISTILRNFELHPATEKPILVAETILKSSNGVHVVLKERKFD